MSDITIAVADAITIADAGALGSGVPRLSADTLALSDSSLRAAGIPQNILSEQLTLSDAIQVLNAIAIIESGSVTVSIDQVSGSLGDTVTVSIHVLVIGNAQPTGIQFTLDYDSADLTLNSLTIGAAGTAAGKQLQSLGNNVIIFGININVIGSGVLATASFTIPLTAVDNPTFLGITNLSVATADNQTITGITNDTVLFSDFLMLSDASKLLLTLALAVSDTLSLSDSISITGPILTDIRVGVGDALSYSDFITRILFANPIFTEVQITSSDAISLSDAIVTARTNLAVLDIQILRTDTLSLSDSVTGLAVSSIGVLDIGLAASDLLTLSDAIQVFVSIPTGPGSPDFIKYIRRYLNDVV